MDGLRAADPGRRAFADGAPRFSRRVRGPAPAADSHRGEHRHVRGAGGRGSGRHRRRPAVGFVRRPPFWLQRPVPDGYLLRLRPAGAAADPQQPALRHAAVQRRLADAGADGLVLQLRLVDEGGPAVHARADAAAGYGLYSGGVAPAVRADPLNRQNPAQAETDAGPLAGERSHPL